MKNFFDTFQTSLLKIIFGIRKMKQPQLRFLTYFIHFFASIILIALYTIFTAEEGSFLLLGVYVPIYFLMTITILYLLFEFSKKKTPQDYRSISYKKAIPLYVLFQLFYISLHFTTFFIVSKIILG